MKPTVSIVTPSYNQGAFLEETIASVLDQGAEVSEYFVLDGGSTDQSKAIIEQFAHRLTGWRSQRDGGQSEAIDEGIRRCSGDVVGWVNSDDVLLPGAVQAVRECFEREPSVDVVVGGCVFIDPESRVLRVSRPPRQTYRAARWGVVHVPQPACFFRRSLYLSCGGLDRNLKCVMDTELWMRMLRASPVWGHLDRFLAGFRIHPQSKGQSWLSTYASEGALLEARHPECATRSARGRAGRALYVAGRALSGGYARDWLMSRRVRSRRLRELEWPE